MNHSSMWKTNRAMGFLVAFAAFFFLSSPLGAAQAESRIRSFEWPQETVELFATLPVQHGGRIKPLDSLAGVNLLMMNGKRTLEAGIDWSLDENGEPVAARTESLKPSAWLLDCFFFPEQARAYRAFRVQDAAILTSIGLESRKKRDWYSFDELLPGLSALSAEAKKAFDVETIKRTPKQRQTIKLNQDLLNFENLIVFLDPMRNEYSTAGSGALENIYGPGKTKGIAGILEHEVELRQLRASISPADSADYSAIQALLKELEKAMLGTFNSPAFFVPSKGAIDQETWWKVDDVIRESVTSLDDHSDQIGAVRGFERMLANTNDSTAFQRELETLHASLVGQAAARGEYKHIEKEVALYNLDPFTRGLVCFLLAFLTMAGSWLKPSSKGLWYGQIGLSAVGTILLIVGIVYRSVIRERPPVVTLYDTILFITAVSLLVAFFTEWLTKRRVAMAGAVLVGVGGLFLAGRYELKEIASSGDTMASVVAVLDTNFYLAIHVTTIAMGYAGGLFAAVLAHAWILGQLFGFKTQDKALYKTIYTMTYGVVCFCLLFSIFGTIMGGIWANDSWGRFWGWDPKENGALLICLWSLLTLHMRLGGFIRDRGFAVMSVFGGIVVSASWWGVNLLNVGLHSYGFTSGVAYTLFVYWVIELAVIGLAAFDHFRKLPKPTVPDPS
ncbi:MAG: cytochrome c biogenesis protein CcsA [Planctomycetota bacterium]|nr:cytochrome c biogenesis protein CcsA [Planctomycetota bacterium]MDG2143976.1 cytochrome c biogenesis protein CcsA [Planctomycetota bacterium]